MYSFAREVPIPHLETYLSWKCPVVHVTTFIVVKAGTVDVEKKQCWHRDINLSYMLPARTNTMLFACFRCSPPHPMMVVLGIMWLHPTRASRTLGWWLQWPHWTSGMCGWAMH